MKINWSLLGGLRFFLATIVALGHTLLFDANSGLARSFAMFGGKAAVVGFLLVSGFSIAASISREETHFYFRRFKRIYPLYFVTVLATIILQVCLGQYQAPNYVFTPNGAWTVIGNLLLLQTFLVKPLDYNGPLWSLAVEVSFYIVTPFMRRLSLRVIVVFVLISSIFYLMPIHVNWGIAYSFLTKANAVKYFWPFAMGFLIFYTRSNALFFILAAFGAFLVWFSDINSEPLAVLTFLISIFVLFLARTSNLPKIAFLDYLGDVSYPLYIVQIPVYIFFFAVFGLTENFVLYLVAVAVAMTAYELIDLRLKRIVFGEVGTKAKSANSARLTSDSAKLASQSPTSLKRPET